MSSLINYKKVIKHKNSQLSQLQLAFQPKMCRKSIDSLQFSCTRKEKHVGNLPCTRLVAWAKEGRGWGEG